MSKTSRIAYMVAGIMYGTFGIICFHITGMIEARFGAYNNTAYIPAALSLAFMLIMIVCFNRATSYGK